MCSAWVTNVLCMGTVFSFVLSLTGQSSIAARSEIKRLILVSNFAVFLFVCLFVCFWVLSFWSHNGANDHTINLAWIGSLLSHLAVCHVQATGHASSLSLFSLCSQTQAQKIEWSENSDRVRTIYKFSYPHPLLVCSFFPLLRRGQRNGQLNPPDFPAGK